MAGRRGGKILAAQIQHMQSTFIQRGELPIVINREHPQIEVFTFACQCGAEFPGSGASLDVHREDFRIVNI